MCAYVSVLVSPEYDRNCASAARMLAMRDILLSELRLRSDPTAVGSDRSFCDDHHIISTQI